MSRWGGLGFFVVVVVVVFGRKDKNKYQTDSHLTQYF